jgi:drug/metabolite transporter (DMT)-like permease
MKNKNILLLFLLATMWGPSFLFIKVAVQDFTPITLVAIRLSLAAIFLFVTLSVNKKKLPRAWTTWRKFVFMGFFANALPFVLFSFGEQYAESGAASILNGTTPIFTVIFANFLIEDERFTANRVGGVLLGFLGILLIFFPDLQGLLSGQGLHGGPETLGLISFIGASACYGIAITYSRANLRGLAPLVGPTMQLICAAGITLPLALIAERPFSLSPGLPSIGAATALGLFGTAIAYLIYYRLLDNVSATFISFVTYLLPPIGVLLGVIFLDEQPGWYSFAGLVLIILGVMVINGLISDLVRRRRPPKAT